MPDLMDSPLVQGLDSDFRLASNVVTFRFLDAGQTIDTMEFTGGDSTTIDWTDAQRDVVRDITAYISTIADLTFEERLSGDVTMEFAQIATLGPDFAGYADLFEGGLSQVVLPTEFIDFDDVTVIHEIGHALGLSHPHDGPALFPGVVTENDAGDFGLNSELTTRMSYRPGEAPEVPGVDILNEGYSFGAVDIAALQLMYGANTATGAGDTTYGETAVLETIWDNGGIDAIDFSAATEITYIDLRAASLAAEEGGGGWLSFVSRESGTLAEGGYTIAHGVEIENAMGGSSADSLFGNELANNLQGNLGDDWFFGFAGDDILNGADGFDGAGFTGLMQNYTLTLNAAGNTMEDRRTDGDGTDQLIGLEFVEFWGGDGIEFFDLQRFGGTQNLNAEDMSSFIELYIAYFNRAPDAIGLNFWGTAFAGGTTLAEMATLFIDQPETRETYDENLSNSEFAQAVYGNVLGRVPDLDGFNFWVGVLDAGSVGRDQFILEVLQGAKAPPPADATPEFIAQQNADQAYLNDKIDIGTYFAVIKGLSDAAEAATVMGLYDGTATGLLAAQAETDLRYDAALDADTGAFLLPLVGVLDDPFAAAMG